MNKNQEISKTYIFPFSLVTLLLILVTLISIVFPTIQAQAASQYKLEQLWLSQEQDGRVFGLDWSPDGRYIIISTENGTVKIFDVITGEEIWHMHFDAKDIIVDWSPDGKYIAVSVHTGPEWGLYVIDTTSRNVTWKQKFLYPSGIAWSPDGQYLAVGGLEHFYLFSKSGRLIWKIENISDYIHIIAWSPDGSKIAFITSNGPLILSCYSLNGTKLWDYVINVEYTSFPTIDWSPDSRYLAVGCWNNNVYVFSSNGTLLWSKNMGGIVRNVAWDPSGEYLAVSGWFGTALFTKNGQLLWINEKIKTCWSLYAHGNLEWNKYELLAIGADKLYILDKKGNILAESENLGDWTLKIAWSPDQTRIAAVGWYKRLYIWRLNIHFYYPSKKIVVAVDLAHGESDKYLSYIEGNITFVEWKEITDKITPDVLKDVDVLILGQPTTGLAPDELQAIKDWLSKGNKIIWIASDSDYGGGPQSQQACNDILQFIGSKLRIELATVYDDVHNAGAFYRVLGHVSPDNLPELRTDIIRDNITLPILYHGPTVIIWVDENGKPPDPVKETPHDPVKETFSGLIRIVWSYDTAYIGDNNPPPPMLYSPLTDVNRSFVLLAAEYHADLNNLIVASGESPYGDYEPTYSWLYRGVELDGPQFIKNMIRWFSYIVLKLGKAVVIFKPSDTKLSICFSGPNSFCDIITIVNKNYYLNPGTYTITYQLLEPPNSTIGNYNKYKIIRTYVFEPEQTYTIRAPGLNDFLSRILVSNPLDVDVDVRFKWDNDYRDFVVKHENTIEVFSVPGTVYEVYVLTPNNTWAKIGEINIDKSGINYSIIIPNSLIETKTSTTSISTTTKTTSTTIPTTNTTSTTTSILTQPTLILTNTSTAATTTTLLITATTQTSTPPIITTTTQSKTQTNQQPNNPILTAPGVLPLLLLIGIGTIGTAGTIYMLRRRRKETDELGTSVSRVGVRGDVSSDAESSGVSSIRGEGGNARGKIGIISMETISVDSLHGVNESSISGAVSRTEGISDAGAGIKTEKRPAKPLSISGSLGKGIESYLVEKIKGLLPGYTCRGGYVEARFPAKIVPDEYAGVWECCRLGCGGWGCSYLCRRGGEKVVLKIPHGFEAIIEGGLPPSVHMRLLKKIREKAKAITSLRHPNILRLLGIGEQAPVLVYEYADQGTLEWQLSQGWEPDRRDLLLLFLQVADALRYIHGRGLIHGDIKPANIFFVDGIAKIGDFSGLKKLLSLTSSRSGIASIYTIGFRAPEQVYSDLRRKTRDLGLEHMIDIYGLGNTILYTLTAETVDGEDTSPERIDEAVKSIEDPEIRELVRKMLDPEPWNRPTAMEIVRTLLNLLAANETK